MSTGVSETVLAAKRAIARALLTARDIDPPVIVHQMLDLSPRETSIAFADEIVLMAQSGERVRDTFVEEVQVLQRLVKLVFFHSLKEAHVPGWFFRNNELFVNDTARHALAHDAADAAVVHALLELAEGMSESVPCGEAHMSGAQILMMCGETSSAAFLHEERSSSNKGLALLAREFCSVAVDREVEFLRYLRNAKLPLAFLRRFCPDGHAEVVAAIDLLKS